MSSALWWVMNGFAAAPPAWLEQDRRLDLGEALLGQHPAGRRDHRGADREDPPRGLVEDQVEVALAVAGLGVGDAVADVGQRPQALREQLELVDPDRQLAVVGGDHRALDADPVAEVEVGELVQLVGADRVAGRHQLDLAGLVLEVGEVEAAVAALGHHPAGEVDHLAGVGAGGEVGELLAQRRRGRVAVEADRVGLDPALAQLLELLQPVGAGLLLELGALGAVGLRRARPSSWSAPAPRRRSSGPILGGRQGRNRAARGSACACDRARIAIPTSAAASAIARPTPSSGVVRSDSSSRVTPRTTLVIGSKARLVATAGASAPVLSASWFSVIEA